MKIIHLHQSVLTGLLACLSVSVSAGPKITPSEGTFSFGKTTQHTVLTKRFWIKSVGDTPARIVEVKPDCGCTELFLADSLVRPNDSTALDLVLHTRSFLGFIEKRPLIRIADSNDTTRIKLYAEIMVKPENAKPLVITPEKVDVSQYSAKTRRKGTFTITNNGFSDYRISVVDSGNKSFEVVLPKLIKAGGKVEGQVIVHKTAVPTSFEESFTFEIDDDGLSRYSVPVWRQYQVKDASATSAGK